MLKASKQVARRVQRRAVEAAYTRRRALEEADCNPPFALARGILADDAFQSQMLRSEMKRSGRPQIQNKKLSPLRKLTKLKMLLLAIFFLFSIN